MPTERPAHEYPVSPVAAGHIEPAPRRVRGIRGGRVAFDTTHALYVWEWPNYPQYHIPLADVDRDAAPPFTQSDDARLADHARFAWDDLDAWYEEDERVFVHPRSPYTRVDALRSSRAVRIELEGLVLAESSSPVMVFETGLPTRYYLDPTAVDFSHLVPSETVTACPYKGRTAGYWSVRAGDALHRDLAWSYAFPTRELLPIAGLIAFYNEHVDVFVDDRSLARPRTHFSRD